MKSMIKELWHGNIIPQEDSRNNSKEMKELLGYMARHHEDLEKTFTDEQKEIFEKFHDCWDEYVSLAEAAIFEYAFRLGARLTMEIQTDKEQSIAARTKKSLPQNYYLLKTTVTVVPMPKSLSMESSAPEIAQMCLTMARPSPVPPIRLEWDLSTR